MCEICRKKGTIRYIDYIENKIYIVSQEDELMGGIRLNSITEIIRTAKYCPECGRKL